TRLPFEFKKRIKKVHMVGDGDVKEKYETLAMKSGISFVFYGFQSREDVHAVYKQSHALVLPSKSEGFPKVIAEAMNYGCIPIVSNVSAIGHYIKDSEHGFLLES